MKTEDFKNQLVKLEPSTKVFVKLKGETLTRIDGFNRVNGTFYTTSEFVGATVETILGWVRCTESEDITVSTGDWVDHEITHFDMMLVGVLWIYIK